MRFCLQGGAVRWEMGLQKGGPRETYQPACGGAEQRGFLGETPPSAYLKPRQEAGAEAEDGDR